MKNSAEKIAMKSYEDISKPTNPEGQQANSGVILPLDQLHPFKHHPLMPILVRPLIEGGFEIISEYNRVEAAKRAEMIDSNLQQREKKAIKTASTAKVRDYLTFSQRRGGYWVSTAQTHVYILGNTTNIIY